LAAPGKGFAARRLGPRNARSRGGTCLATSFCRHHPTHQPKLKEHEMRKHAPALIITALFAFASSSALAMGDRHKEKKATTDKATSTQSTPSSSSGYSTPGTPSSVNSTTSSAAPDTTRQMAKNDPKCDEAKYASRSAMPKECFEKPGVGATPSNKVPAQSGSSASGSSSSSSSSK
jgi:hypothetical protein